jgi:hypothetical protein
VPELNKQKYYVLQINLLFFSGLHFGDEIDFEKICVEIYNLSWLNVNPLFPYRESPLPFHINKIIDLETNYF